MKKSIVVLLLAVAVIVIVSPGIVGRLAEQSMDENLDWAARDAAEIQISSQGFDRGWFSSEGQHRIDIKGGELRDSLLALAGQGGFADLPTLIIDTHIDHGLVPIGSITREKGSLAPGLGSAVSTLSLEFEDGQTIDLPGTIYSEVSLTGELESNLIMEPGTFEVDGETAHWGDIDIVVTLSPSSSVVGVDGSIEEIALVSAYNELTVAGVRFEGEQQQTRFGFAIGEGEISVETIGFPSDFGRMESGPLAITSQIGLDDDRMSAHTTVDIDTLPFGELGPTRVGLDIAIEDVDAEAFSRLSRTIDDFDSYGSGDALMVAAEPDLEKLLASGFEVHVKRLDLSAPPGSISATLDATVAPTDIDSFVMTSLLLAIDAELDLSMSKGLFDYLVTLDPQFASAAAMGFLVQNENAYEMAAEFEDGLLKVNGAPIPIPLQSGN